MLRPLSIFTTALLLTIVLTNCSRSQRTEYVSFVREDKVEESKQRKGNLSGRDIVATEFDTGRIRFWAPTEVPPHPRDPKKPFVGKFRSQIDVLSRERKEPSVFRLLRFDFSNLSDGSNVAYMYGRYYDPNQKRYQEFVSPEEIIGRKIGGNKGSNSIELKLGIPKNVQSFDIAFEIEVEYQGKSETIKFEDHFVRSTYTYIPSG